MTNVNDLAAVAAEAAEGASKPTPQAAQEPKLKEAAAASQPPAPAPDLDGIRREAAAAERARIVALDQIALPGCEAIIAAAKSAGTTPEQAAVEVVRHLKETGALDISKQMATAAASVPAIADLPHDPVGAAAAAKPAAGTEAAWRAEFAASETLQAEFGGDEDSYVAYRKARAEGRARISGQKEA
jgi:hypothetical protein